MANQETKNFAESMVNAQKQVVDSMVENTKKLANGNAMVNDTIEKGTEWYKNWLDSQKNFFTKTTDKANEATATAKENVSNMNEFYQNWFNTQMGWAKQMWEMNLDYMKNATTANNTAANMNPTTMWNNWMNTWNNMAGNMNQAANWTNQANNWMAQMQNMNPFNMDAWKKSSENWTGLFNQYYELLNNNFAEMQKNFQAGSNMQDTYRNMVNTAEGFTRFAEMWMPMWKSIQDKTFNTEMYKQWMNPATYKEMMDKFFGFMPENSRQYMQNMADMMQNGMGQFNQAGMNQYQQMRNAMASMMPASGEVFGNILNSYNAFYNMMSNTAAPMIKMMTPNQQTKTMLEWNDIANRMMVYSIKNSELQYMIYNQGVKVMDQLAENITAKVQKGEDMSNMLGLYQEWLNLSDKTFVSLFESEDYSRMMAEVSSLQMKLRKDVEGEMEKFLVAVPVATRSEMDELYKTIYDLKKQVRQLEKMLEIDETATEGEEAAEKKTTSRSKKA